jgi:hypothetical protein
MTTVVPQNKKEEFTQIINEVIKQMREDVSTYNNWQEFHDNDEGMKAYQTSVPNDSNKKVKGEAIITTKLNPREFFAFIDGKLQLLIIKHIM